MKKVLMLAGASVASFICSSALAMNMGVVDMQEIFSSSHGISQIQAKLQSQFSGKRNKMVKMMKSLQSEQKSLDKNRAVWSKSKIDQAESKLKSDQTKFQMAQATYQKEVMSAQQEAMKNFIDKIKTAAQKTAKDDKLDMVFVSNSVLYAKDAKDVTSSVMGNLD